MSYVLVVEDDQAIRELISVVLHGEQLAVTCAATAEEAVRLATNQRPSLVLLDIVLPGGGQAVATALRARYGAGLPLIIISALSRDRIQKLADELQPSAWIAKPFDVDELVAAVKLGLREH